MDVEACLMFSQLSAPLQQQPEYLLCTEALLLLSHIAAGSCVYVYTLIQLSAAVFKLAHWPWFVATELVVIYFHDSSRSWGAAGSW